MTLAVLTVLLFTVRIFLRFRQSPKLQSKLMRISPHIIHTMLLVLGVWLAFYSGVLSENPWIIAKIIALVLYMALSFYIFKWAKSNSQVLIGALAGWLMLIYIFSVAFTKSAFPF